MNIFNDERPNKPVANEIGSDLSMLSVDELEARVRLLKSEIDRVEGEIQSKAAGRRAADSLFRS